MKKIILILLLIGGFSYTQAQRSKVVSAYNYAKPKYNELEKAMKAIDEAKDHKKTKDEAKTWYYRGMIYQQIYQDTAFRHLHPNPLVVAMKSFKKSLELDERGRWKDDVINLFNIAMQQSLNQGIKFIRSNQPEPAFKTFKQIIESAAMEQTHGIEKVDPSVFYFAAIAAQQAKDLENANKYYQKSIEYGTKLSKSYLLMAQNYKQLQDTAQYVSTLQEGLENAEDNKKIMLNLVDYYQKSGKLEAALKYMKKAIKKDTANVTLYFAMGNVYSAMDQPQKAQEAYNEAMKIDPDNVDIMFNMGTLFFNDGADLKNQANELPLEAKKQYDSLLNRANDKFAQAAKYFEKANELAPKDEQILKTLKKIYMQLRNVESDIDYKAKLEKVNKQIESL